MLPETVTTKPIFHKDLMIDSSRFGIDGTAKILADIVKNQWG